MRRAVYDFVRQGHGDGGKQKAESRKRVDGTLPHHLLFREIGRIDERLQQMNRQNADDGHRQFDFQIITIVSRLAIITTSIRLSTASMTVFHP
jgi:hypothetical protein